METIVQTKQCKHCGISFDITDKDLEFYDKVSPVFNGKKCLIPTPTFCPNCRQQRRRSFRNERKLYKKKCDLSGKNTDGKDCFLSKIGRGICSKGNCIKA